ncbi:MAG: hypothetical protein AB7G47_10735 [Mycolicibacterium sp.]|uniref:hypothetical protein n=1 Tax=Mycolicibacterium sp. TaxID=2320850 RepID=UPI003D0CFFF9
MSVDVVVARAAAALSRGHSLFSPAPLDAAPGLSGSSQTLTSLSNRIAASPQRLGAQGQFADAYGDVAQRFSGRLSGTGALDAKLSSLLGQAAAADAAGRNQSATAVNAAAADTARTAPLTNTPAGQRALLIALRDRINQQRHVIEAHKARDATLAALVRQLAYRRSPGTGSAPATASGLSGIRPPTSSGAGMSMPNFGGIIKAAAHGPSGAGAIGRPPHEAGGLLTRNSTPRQVAARIIWEAWRRGYSPQQAIAILSTGLQESRLDPRAVGGGGAWHGIFQQDTSYPGRDDPNRNIGEFFNRLDGKGGSQSRNIWQSIFWLQQRPGDATADLAFARGRQAYLGEIQGPAPTARELYREITETDRV